MKGEQFREAENAPVRSLGAKALVDMFAASTNVLGENVSDIDSLNVFPVPDGDTGTNMLLTMNAALEEASSVKDENVLAIAGAFARGSFMGARGNSGVILSQFFQGLKDAVNKRERFDGIALAQGLQEASKLAYKSLSRPVEGTILTVLREAADAASRKIQKDETNLIDVMQSCTIEAKLSVEKTPQLLPVLKDAGVVDAGGYGLYIILQGALNYLKGETYQTDYKMDSTLIRKPLEMIEEKESYGYCTEFVLEGESLHKEKIRQILDKEGQSIIIAGTDKKIKVHMHTLDPGAVISYATTLGSLQQIKIQNMDDQHGDYIQQEAWRKSAAETASIVVASGEGFTRLFHSLGASTVIAGGRTMNPSAREILEAVESVPSKSIIFIANNPNIIPVAQQVRKITGKRMEVVGSLNMAQGVAAMIAFNEQSDLESNTRSMERAAKSLKVAEITRSIRDSRIGQKQISKGQYLLFYNGDFITSGNDIFSLLNVVWDLASAHDAELITIYYGEGVGQHMAEDLAGEAGKKFTKSKVELVHGGQPNYQFIVSVE